MNSLDGFYEAKGAGFWNCTVLVSGLDVCGRPVANTAYDIEAHMRARHPFKFHDENCDPENVKLSWDYVPEDEKRFGTYDEPLVSAMLLICDQCATIITLTTIRPGNIQSA